MIGTIYIIIVAGLIILFFISLSLYINNILRKLSDRKSQVVRHEEKMNKIIKQNEKIISLLEKHK